MRRFFLFLFLLLCCSAFAIPAFADTVTVTESIDVTDLAYYDIWKHSDGTWQYGKKPGSSVSASFSISIGSRLPAGAQITSVSGSYNLAYSGAYAEYCVPSASVRVDSYGAGQISYTVSTTLVGSPEDVRLSSQSEAVEGYRYYIPSVFTITYKYSKDVSDTPPSPGEEPEMAHAFSASAVLDLPPFTYEGHVVLAEDRSLFEIDGEPYSALEVYAADLGSNSFRVSSGSLTRVSDVGAEAVFPSAGTESVLLTVRASDGTTDTDTRFIEVRRTPDITARLGGSQKANRRQTLSVSVATNPLYPLSSLSVELSRKDGSESVVIRDISVNSETIKTRALEDTGSTRFSTEVLLEFLTKNDTAEEFTYRVFAEDSRGYTSEVSADFTVLPDLAPDVLISVADEYLREKSGDTAYVYAEDVSVTDDNAVRTWYVRENVDSEWTAAGISAASLGSTQRVCYTKRGVGPVEFRLDVTDKWDDATLPEYVTSADYKSGSATARTAVGNIAPVVSLELLKAADIDVLVLAESDNELSLDTSDVRRSLLEQNLSANIDIVRVKSDAELNTGSLPDTVFTYSRDFGYGTESDLIEKGWYMADSRSAFVIDGTWSRNSGVSGLYYYNVSAPYTVTAFDIASGDVRYSFTVNGDVQSMAQDDRDRYLFLRTGSSTLVYTKDTGAYAGTIGFVVGDDNYLSGDKLVSVKAGAVYSVDLRSGSVTTLYSGAVLAKSSYCDNAGYSTMLGGRIYFAAGYGLTVNCAVLDPVTEELRLRTCAPSSASYASSYEVLGFGSDGSLALARDGKSAAYVIDASGNEIFSASGWNTSYEREILPAYNADGTFDYLAVLANREDCDRESCYYEINAYVYRIDGTEDVIYYRGSREVGPYASCGSGTDASRSMYAVRVGSDVIIDVGNWMTSISDGSSLSNYYYTYFTQFIADTKAGTMRRLAAPDANYTALNAGGAVCEYGRRTSDFVLSAYSWDSASQPYGTSPYMQSVTAARLPMTASCYRSNVIRRFASDGTIVIDGAYDLANRILEAATDSFTAVRTDDAVLSRAFALDPATEYFYELSYKTLAATGSDSSVPAGSGAPLPLSVSVITDGADQDGADQGGANSVYRVARIETEDFNDAAVNPFFSGTAFSSNAGDGNSRIRGGVLYSAELCFGYTRGSNYTMSDSTAVTFEVPEGQAAVLSFDYSLTSYTGAPDELYVEINGERWYRNNGLTEQSGTYTHLHLLPAGTNTVTCVTKGYGTLPIRSSIALDNLRVVFLDPGSDLSDLGDASSDSDLAGSDSASSLGSYSTSFDKTTGFTTLTGSFTTPCKTVSYVGQPMDYVCGPANDVIAAKDYIVNERPQYQNYLTLNIPDGKYAAHTAITINTATTDGRSLTWTFDNKTIRIYYEASYGNYPYYIPYEFRLNSRTSSGSIYVSPSRLYRTTGEYTVIEQVLTDSMNEAIEEGRFFVDPAAGLLFSEGETFSGSVVLSLGAAADAAVLPASMYIKSFSLYHIENGRKVYDAEDISAFTASGGSITSELLSFEKKPAAEEALVYRKGETVKQKTFYSDYENDPGKREYWRYTHTPANDGLHPDSGKVLAAPITQFYIDGKYEVEHWQEDNTGNPDYDKLSNVVRMTFYITGGGEAPWIKTIATAPSEPAKDDSVSFRITVDDKEKDVLDLTTEVYFESRKIFTHTASGLAASALGTYPAVLTDAMPDPVRPGRYTVVCTVSDGSAIGIKSYAFTVASAQVDLSRIRIHRLF